MQQKMTAEMELTCRQILGLQAKLAGMLGHPKAIWVAAKVGGDTIHIQATDCHSPPPVKEFWLFGKTIKSHMQFGTQEELARFSVK